MATIGDSEHVRTKSELYTVQYFVNYFESHRNDIDFYYACKVNAVIELNADGINSDEYTAQVLRNAWKAYDSLRFPSR